MGRKITDPKDFARHISEKILADYLQFQNPPIAFGVKSKAGKKKKSKIDEDMIERFMKTVNSQPDKVQNEIFVEMLYINELSTPRHLERLETEALSKGERVSTKALDECNNNDERALWWYVNHKNIFDDYFQRADTENLAGMKEHIIPEDKLVDIDELKDIDKLNDFGAKVTKIYENSLRGKKMKTTHFPEEDRVIVRVYLENIPDNQMVFNESNELAHTASVRPVFSIVCIYDPKDTSFGVRAIGGNEMVTQIQEVFCQTFLGCSIGETSERKYNIEDKCAINKLELTPEPMSNIERVYLKAIEYKKSGDWSKTVRLDVGGRNNTAQGTGPMEMLIKEVGIDTNQWKPKKFEIKFIFKKSETGKGRKRQFTTNITEKGVNLQNTPEDNIAKAFLKEKGFIQ